jgi:hypothetical protein
VKTIDLRHQTFTIDKLLPMAVGEAVRLLGFKGPNWLAFADGLRVAMFA